MEKILIDDGKSEGLRIVCHDVDNNAIKSLPSVYCNRILVPDDDGQVITNTEVANYKKGDIVIILRRWVDGSAITKVVIVSDAFSKDDLMQWYQAEKTYMEERLKKDQTCGECGSCPA